MGYVDYSIIKLSDEYKILNGKVEFNTLYENIVLNVGGGNEEMFEGVIGKIDKFERAMNEVFGRVNALRYLHDRIASAMAKDGDFDKFEYVAQRDAEYSRMIMKTFYEEILMISDHGVVGGIIKRFFQMNEIKRVADNTTTFKTIQRYVNELNRTSKKLRNMRLTIIPPSLDIMTHMTDVENVGLQLDVGKIQSKSANMMYIMNSMIDVDDNEQLTVGKKTSYNVNDMENGGGGFSDEILDLIMGLGDDDGDDYEIIIPQIPLIEDEIKGLVLDDDDDDDEYEDGWDEDEIDLPALQKDSFDADTKSSSPNDDDYGPSTEERIKKEDEDRAKKSDDNMGAELEIVDVGLGAGAGA